MSLAAVPPRDVIRWEGPGFSFGGFHFTMEFGSGISEAFAPYPSFILMKSRDIVDAYIDILPRRDQYHDVLELGIMKGGSCVFFNALTRPQRHMALDIYEQKSGLAQFAQHVSGQGRSFLPRFDISQDDIPGIVGAFEKAFGAPAEFDLIIDDASHNYELSVKSFNGLFPRLRPGGLYAIEDWGWAHWGGPFQEPDHPEAGNPALSNLAIHTMLAVTGAGGIVSEVIVKPNTVFVVRGPTNVPAGWTVQQSVPRRGRTLPLY